MRNIRLSSVEAYVQRGNTSNPTIGAQLWASTAGGTPDRNVMLEASTNVSPLIPTGIVPLYF